jgi:hypothetical protein
MGDGYLQKMPGSTKPNFGYDWIRRRISSIFINIIPSIKVGHHPFNQSLFRGTAYLCTSDLEGRGLLHNGSGTTCSEVGSKRS